MIVRYGKTRTPRARQGWGIGDVVLAKLRPIAK